MREGEDIHLKCSLRPPHQAPSAKTGGTTSMDK